MKCGKCGETIADNIVYEFKDKEVCDDCYIDLLIGTPDVDISKLPAEIQSDLHRVMKNWHRTSLRFYPTRPCRKVIMVIRSV